MEAIAQKILREGVQSVKVSMLSPELRLRLLSDAGDKLLHSNHLPQAAGAYALGGNIKKLRETGEWLMQQQRVGEAAMFLKHVGSPDELTKLGEECVALGEFRAAKEIYEELNDETMVSFLEENFSV